MLKNLLIALLGGYFIFKNIIPLGCYAFSLTDKKKILQKKNFSSANRLSGGLTNKTYKVTVNDRSYAVRIGTKDTERLGIKRELELKFHTLGTLLNISPAIIYENSQEGVLITEFINGKIPMKEDLQNDQLLLQIIQVLKKLHTVKNHKKKKIGQYYLESISGLLKHSSLGTDIMFSTIQEALLRAKLIYKNMPFETVLVASHNDFFARNLIYDGNKLWVIDWEYSNWDSLYNDLASFVMEDKLDAKQEEFILKEYFGSPTHLHRYYFKFVCALYSLQSSIWSLSQSHKAEDLHEKVKLRKAAQHHLKEFWKNMHLLKEGNRING